MATSRFLDVFDWRRKHMLAIPVLSLLILISFAAAGYADSSTPPARVAAGPFTKGSRLWSVTVGRSVDERLGRISLIQLSINDYILDDLAIHYGATFGYAETKRTRSGIQGGPEIGVRWHFAKVENWSTYLDGSVAAVFHQYPLKEETLRFNFDVQAGVGATYRLNEKAMLHGGFCWHHLSNARIRGKVRNYGYDAPMSYLGLMWSF